MRGDAFGVSAAVERADVNSRAIEGRGPKTEGEPSPAPRNFKFKIWDLAPYNHGTT